MVRSAHGKQRLRRQIGVVVGVAVVVGAASAYTVHTIVLAASIAKKLPVIEQSYQRRQWGIALNQLDSLAPAIRDLSAESHSMRVFEFVPGIGPRLRMDVNVLSVLQDVAMAARDVQPVVTQLETKHGVIAVMRKIRPAAIVASAQGIDAIAHLPDFPPSSPFASLNRVKRRIRPLLSLATLVMRHPDLVSLLWGYHAPERFLLIFQDNGELRSTGGFIAADGLLTLYHGQIRIMFNSDIAKTADAIRIHEAAPWVLRTYFGERYISFINANLNPDVPASAHVLQKLYDSIPHHPHISGVIFLDSWLADRLVAAVGKVVAGGRTFTAANFYPEVEYLAEGRGLGDSTRMQFLGRILEDLDAKIQDPDMLAPVLRVLRDALAQKHLMVDADNPMLQRWFKQQHWTGALPVSARQNSLFVVNDNYGGRKDNHFMTSQVGIALKKLSSSLYEETVTTTWTLSGIRNGWLVGTYVGWVQCYVPEGTKLIRLSGYHVHGIRMAAHPSLKMTAFGTGIQIAPRINASTPPHTETLRWVFVLPRLAHPRRLHVIIQPGLPGQQLEYRSSQGRVIVHQVHNEVVTVN